MSTEEVEVEVLNRLAVLEAGTAESLRELLRVAPLDFVVEEPVEEFRVVEIAAARPACAGQSPHARITRGRLPS